MVYLEIFIVLVLTLLNGVLAMSELAVVSSRRARLEHMASFGDRGARSALRLIDDPNRFLSTVQIGITLVGIGAGAYSGATLGERLGAWLDGFGLISPYGEAIGVPVVVVLITYLALIVGELVPKRIALANPERIAALVSPPMHRLSTVAAPAVWLLRVSTDSVLRLLGLRGTKESSVTEEEVRSLIAEGTQAGIFVPQEREMIDGVLRLADRAARAIMTPRTEIVWLDLHADRDGIVAALERGRVSRLIICDGSIDHPLGVLHTKDLTGPALRGDRIDLAAIMVPPIVVPEGASVLRLLERFRKEGVHMAVVVDEFGTTLGIVTPTDVLESIAGDLPEQGEDTEPWLVQRDDGSWLVDGLMPIDEFEDRTGIRGLRQLGSFNTVAGFVLDRFGRLPAVCDAFTFRDIRFEVVDLDGRRIDKLLVSPPHAEA